MKAAELLDKVLAAGFTADAFDKAIAAGFTAELFDKVLAAEVVGKALDAGFTAEVFDKALDAGFTAEVFDKVLAVEFTADAFDKALAAGFKFNTKVVDKVLSNNGMLSLSKECSRFVPAIRRCLPFVGIAAASAAVDGVVGTATPASALGHFVLLLCGLALATLPFLGA